MKKHRIISVLSAFAVATFNAVPCVYAENSGMVYGDFNENDVNATVIVNTPENTTAEIKITFTSPEVTDTPYYIINTDGEKSVSMDIEGRDTTENDYRNYTLSVSLKSTEYDQTVTYTDTFNVPDGNDNPESFIKTEYNFSFDNEYSVTDWTSSENETGKNIVIHYGNAELGDVDGDGFVNAVDASIVSIEYALLSSKDGKGVLTEKQTISADVNKDGFVNAVDASIISIYYAKLSIHENPTWEDIIGNQASTGTPDYSSYVETVNIMAGNITDSMQFHRYYIYDINKDGTYELITEMGESEEDNKYSVYSLKGKEVIFAGDIEAGYSHLTTDGENLYKVYGQAQTADVDKISFDGKKITTETVGNETEINTGTAVVAYDLTNISGINKIMNYEPFRYFDTTNAGEDFIFNANYSAGKATVKTSGINLNLREKPTTTDSEIITAIPNNSVINIYGNNGKWAYISYSDGSETYYGYASMSYIVAEIITTTSTTETTNTETTTTTTATTENNFSINDYSLYEIRLQEINTAIKNNEFDSSLSPVYAYNSPKGYILRDLNDDNTPELIITADYESTDTQGIIEVYSIYENQLVKICKSEEQINYHLCDNNVLAYSGRSGMNELLTAYYQYISGDSLDSIGTLIYRNTETGVTWSYENSYITEDEAKEIQEKYKAFKVQSNSFDNIPIITTTETTTTTTTTTTSTASQTLISISYGTAPPQAQHIYRTKSGKKYHYENPCGSGTYYEVTLEEALSAGLTPCEKCVLH